MVKRSMNKKQSAAAPAKQYERTKREQVIAKANNERYAEASKLPKFKVNVTDEQTLVEMDHADVETASIMLMEALGTTNGDFAQAIIYQIARAQGSAPIDEVALNQSMAMVVGVKPQDEVEAMLATQMTAIHNATMTHARRLAAADTYMESEIAEKALNKLARTFTTEVETLSKYRGKGQQTMTVEHVHVHEGGQAIVGNVGGGKKKK